MFYYKSKKLKA